MADVVIVPTQEAAGEIAADVVAAFVASHEAPVLGFATGSTPLSTYRALAERGIPADRIRGFALDEYVGLEPGHPQSYRAVIDREVVETLALRPGSVRVPGDDGLPLESAGERYENDILAAGGIGLQILGIGSNGHLGFNEPGSSLSSRTRIARLSAETRAANARFFDSGTNVPLHCITQGLGTIRDARRLILLAFGTGKAPAVAQSLEGPITARMPGSLLQLHPDVLVVVDEAAASLLTSIDSYRHAHRPS